MRPLFDRRAFLSAACVLLGLAALSPGCGPAGGSGGVSDERSSREAADAEPLHLVVLHTNDVHGQLLPRRDVGGLARLAARVSREREALPEGSELLVVDAGDWFQGTPEGRIEGGGAFLDLMARVGYDALAVGNHELDYGVQHLEALLEEHRLPAVCANVRDPRTGARVTWGAPWRIFERGGVRIALVGLLAVETPTITHPSAREFEFLDPALAFEEARAELADQADLVLPLTHIGFREDARIAAEIDAPLIIGGHSHTPLPSGSREGDTLIVQAGSKARFLGRVDLWIDRAEGTVIQSDARLIELTEAADASDPAFTAAAAELEQRASADMDTVVGRLAAPLSRSTGALASSGAGNLITDAFRARAGVPLAIHNKGGIRASIAAGEVTRRDLFEVLPFDNSLVVLDVTGAELVAALRRAVESADHASVEVSGMRLRVETPGSSHSPLLAVELEDGTPIDPSARYAVATNSFLARGGDDLFAPDVTVQIDTGHMLRDVVEEVFARAAPDAVTPPTDERFLGAR